MSKLLINEHPLQVLPSLAVKIGLNEAIVLQQVHYWAMQGKNEVNGYSWVYNSVAEWKSQFPFWSEQTIRRTIASLKERGLLIAECLSTNRFDRTPYYRIDHAALSVVEHAKLEPTSDHDQNETAVDAKLVASDDAKLKPSDGAKLVSTSSTETTETSSETNDAGRPQPAKGAQVQGDLLADDPARAAKPTKSTNAKATKPEVFDAKAWLLERDVDPKYVAAWLEVRRVKRGVNSEVAFEAIERDAAKVGASLADAVTFCAEKGHLGFHIDAWLKHINAMTPSAAQRGGFMTTQERNLAISEANMRAFLEADAPPPGLFAGNEPFTIDMEH